MNQEEKLKDYLKEQSIQATIENEILFFEENSFQYKIIDEKEILFDDEFNFLPEKNEVEVGIYEGWIYEICGRWYTHLRGEDVKLNEFIYVGKTNDNIKTNYFLGIRSGYELMNGTGLYKDYIKKSKFLGVRALGICEKNTLRGVFDFQQQCLNNDIKPIFGMTISISSGVKIFEVKCYAKNFQGWQNLLKFSAKINIDDEDIIPIEFLKDNSNDLFIIIDPKNTEFKDAIDFANFYQLDTVEFSNINYDKRYLDNLEKFISSNLEPISITDSFYLEKDYEPIREMLWQINKSFDIKTKNQYFKSKSQYASELKEMFVDGCNSWKKLFKKAILNEKKVVDGCSFIYDTNTRHLPKYIMSEEQSKLFKSNDELFLHLVKKGLNEMDVKDMKTYIERLKKEIGVLKMGDVIDYFLSLYDIIQYANKEKLITGIGRGSAGGSLVAYLMGLIKLNPLDFDLIFERFLNSGRMGEWKDKPLYIFKMEDGSEIKLAEGSLLKVIRNGKEEFVFVDEILESDDIIKY